MLIYREYAPQREMPLLYWATFLYMVGVPNFLHFDTSGRTHANGLFNITSVCEILIALTAAYALFLTIILERRTGSLRKVRFTAGLWMPLLAIFTLATTLEPASRMTLHSSRDLLISFYRLFEWLVGFGVILTLCRRVPPEYRTQVVVDLIGRTAWTWVLMVWLFLPLMPSQVYGESEGMPGAAAASRLGGQFLSPSYLATLAIAAFFYALLIVPPGMLRRVGCLLATVTLLLAHTRIEQFSFVILLFIYAVFLSRKVSLRILTLGVIGAATGLALIFRDAIVGYLARGQTLQTLATLDGRLAVWQASLEAARYRPYLGYGFVVGAKNAIRDYWTQTNWIPPHAHNEYLHALITGGVAAAVLVAAIYGRMLWSGLRMCRRDACGAFLFLLAILFFFRSLGGSNFTIGYTRAGAAFLLTYIATVSRDPQEEPPWISSTDDNSPAEPVLEEAGSIVPA